MRRCSGGGAFGIFGETAPCEIQRYYGSSHPWPPLSVSSVVLPWVSLSSAAPLSFLLHCPISSLLTSSSTSSLLLSLLHSSALSRLSISSCFDKPSANLVNLLYNWVFFSFQRFHTFLSLILFLFLLPLVPFIFLSISTNLSHFRIHFLWPGKRDKPRK